MTNNAFLIKIIPPEGYNVYRLHVSRTAMLAGAVALVALVLGALGVHAWQLHVAEDSVRALQAQTVVQSEQLNRIDEQADSLEAQLRELQRQDAEIRRLLGVGGAAVRAGSPHALVQPPARASTSMAAVAARLAGLSNASQASVLDAQRLARITRRVLNVRRLAEIARVRMIAALPSLNPVGGAIASGYGWRASPWPEFHRGVDLEADYGAPVHAAAEGIVVAAGWDGGFGIKVDLDHGNGYHTWYAHLSRVGVAVGERVRKGQTVAFVGATGEATGPHLHYQVMFGGRPIDPAPFLNGIPPNVLATLPGPKRVQ